MVLEDIKDPDGWTQLLGELGINSEETRRRYFRWGEYGSVEIEVNDKLQIVGGRIIPRHA